MKENAMEDKMTDAQKEAPIQIDYDNVDAADIMDQIKRRIAQRPQVPAGAPAATGEEPSGVVPAAPGGMKRGLATRAMRLLARPFMPIVRVLLDRFIVRANVGVNIRIDEVSDGLNMRIDKVYGRIDEVYGRIDDVSGGLNTARENTKLLHTLAHNLVVELTKLRIEYETLKSKMRIMEKDFEVLGKREKALEKRVIE
jgi:hypothetical protein